MPGSLTAEERVRLLIAECGITEDSEECRRDAVKVAAAIRAAEDAAREEAFQKGVEAAIGLFKEEERAIANAQRDYARRMERDAEKHAATLRDWTRGAIGRLRSLLPEKPKETPPQPPPSISPKEEEK